MTAFGGLVFGFCWVFPSFGKLYRIIWAHLGNIRRFFGPLPHLSLQFFRQVVSTLVSRTSWCLWNPKKLKVQLSWTMKWFRQSQVRDKVFQQCQWQEGRQEIYTPEIERSNWKLPFPVASKAKESTNGGLSNAMIDYQRVNFAPENSQRGMVLTSTGCDSGLPNAIYINYPNISQTLLIQTIC